MRDIAAMMLFREDFAAPRRTVPPPEPVPAPITQADLAASYSAGHAAGEQAGRDAASCDLGTRVAETLALIATRLDAMHTAAAHAAEEGAAAVARLLLDALGAAMPTLQARFGEAELRRFFAAVVPALTRESGVILRVHPALAAAAAQQLAALPRHGDTAPRIETCDQIALGDAIVEWDGGCAVRDSAQAWRDVAEVLQPLGLLSQSPPLSPQPE